MGTFVEQKLRYNFKIKPCFNPCIDMELSQNIPVAVLYHSHLKHCIYFEVTIQSHTPTCKQ